MAIKLVIFAAFVAVAKAGLISSLFGYEAAPAALTHAVPVAHAVETDYHHDPHYSYGYDVQDAKTGDSKSQHETRVGDAVEGSYSLLESDGTRRTVKYTADAHNGFNAVVHKEPAHVAIKTVAVAPVAHHEAVPVVHHVAPVVHHAAPVVHHVAPVVHHVAPAHSKVSEHHSASSVSHPSAPVVHYEAAPVVHHVAPVVHHVAPAHTKVAEHHSASSVSHHSAPVVHYETAPVAHYAAAPVSAW